MKPFIAFLRWVRDVIVETNPKASLVIAGGAFTFRGLLLEIISGAFLASR